MFARLVGSFAVVAVVGGSAAADTITLTADATEVVKLKPDQAKIYLTVDTKDATAEDATKANAETRKKLTDAVDKVGVKGLKATALQQKVTKDRENSGRIFRGGGGGAVMPPAVESYSVAQPMVFALSDPDSVKLVANVEKILQAAAGVGVTGDTPNNDYRFSPYGDTRSGARVVYAVKDGWDAPTADALAKATAKAVKNAEALAKGAGLKVVQVQTVEDVTDPAPADPNGFGGRGFRSVPFSDDALADDIELTRTVRVRVKVTAGK